MVKKRICIFTGSRAEYGLLRPLISALKKDKDFEVCLLVSGTHASREFGLTHQQITKDGVAIDALIKIMSADNSAQGVARAMSTGLVKFTGTLTKWKPQLVIILGDRFEAMAMAIAAMLSRIPIAHLYGGEATYGLIDEAIRHAITKMSYLHFTSTHEYRRRVIQLGESPRRVFNVGAIGVDNIKELDLWDRQEFEQQLGISLKKRNLLITFHPVTLEPGCSPEYFQALLNVLDRLKDTQLIFTKANSDMEGTKINSMTDHYVRGHQDKAIVFTSMGQCAYLSAMKNVDAVVGNSSSGIIEAPLFKIGTINIGSRQGGRIGARSIINCLPDEKNIYNAFRKLYHQKFQNTLAYVKSPYGHGNTAAKIVKVLKKEMWPFSLKKKFYDLKGGQ